MAVLATPYRSAAGCSSAVRLCSSAARLRCCSTNQSGTSLPSPSPSSSPTTPPPSTSVLPRLLLTVPLRRLSSVWRYQHQPMNQRGKRTNTMERRMYGLSTAAVTYMGREEEEDEEVSRAG